MHTVEKCEGVPQLRWPLPIDVLAGNPELAQATLADAAQAHARNQQEAQPRSDASATEPFEYREPTGSASTCLCACQAADALPLCTTHLLDHSTPHDMQMTWDTPFGFDRCCSAAGRHYEEAAPQPQATATKPCACRTACAADQHER